VKSSKNNTATLGELITAAYASAVYVYISCKGNKTVPGTVATTRTADGHKQDTKTSITV
jgi:hypothetical protein